MSWRGALPALRGRLVFDAPLAPYTWLRVGGPADALFLPADEEDLAVALRALAPDVPVTVLGAGSNLIVRDGGVRGLVVRLAGRAFGDIAIQADESGAAAGAGALDARLARGAAKAGVAGLEFLAGIPGTIGGALIMNAGCYGSETAQVLQVAWGVDRQGERRAYTPADLRFAYRRSEAPPGVVWTGAVFRGRPGVVADCEAAIQEITGRRESSQPIRERTGGSTFKNPPGASAWRLVDEAGWRGRGVGGAIISPLHANFLINTGSATAGDLEDLGERIRDDVLSRTGIQLDWEIRRIGERERI